MMDRRKVLLVDGYNVIRNNSRYVGLGADYNDDAWNKAREALINDAALMANQDYERCTVVFDGAGNVNSEGIPKKKAGIQVVFSPSGVSADSVIEQLAHDAREEGLEVVVVSSDFTIQSTVFGGGVTRMSAAAFSNVSEVLEEEWHDAGERVRSKTKNTLGDRIDPDVAEKLRAMLRGE